jgi:TonB-dependent receptor
MRKASSRRIARVSNWLLSVSLAGIAAPAAYAGDVIGRVADASGAKSLPGAEVTVVETGRTAITGRGGEFRINDLAAGDYTLRVRYSGAAPAEARVSVGASGVVEADFTLTSVDGADEILVIGQRASLASALNRQRNADSLKSIVTRDLIGQLPDQNVTEAIRRLPGVNVLNDQGEGRFFVLRGLDPNLNSTSINGVRVPAPEGDVRGVALDVIPSELVESIEVQKSLTPDMDGDALGGSVDINTTSAFDRKGTRVAVIAEGQFNNLQDRLSPKVGFDASTIFGGKLGVAAGFSWQDRRFGSENAEASDFQEEDGVFFPEEIEFRDYVIRRNRIGATLNLDYKLSDSTTFFARGLYSRFLDDEFRSIERFEFDEGATGGAGLLSLFDVDQFDADEGNEITIGRDVRSRLEIQEIISLTAGGVTFAGPWTLRHQFGYSLASESEPGTVQPIFERSFEPGDGLIIAADFANLVPSVSVTPDGDIRDTDEFELDVVEFTDGFTEDREWSGKFDLARNFNLASGRLELQIGGKFRLREKFLDVFETEIEDFEFDDDVLLTPFVQPVEFGLAEINPLPGGQAFVDFFDANRAGFVENDAVTTFLSAAASYRAEEDIFAGYGLARFENGPLRAILGLRVEHTQNDLFGNLVAFIEEEEDDDGNVITPDTTIVTPTVFENDYTNLLPSLNLRYQAGDDVIIRLAGYRSLGRPNFEQLAPRFEVEDNEGAFGNPFLQPFTAWNADVGFEWYFEPNAVVSVGGFYKRINDFIFEFEGEEEDFASLPFAGGGLDTFDIEEFTVFLNGEDARVLGLEFAYQQNLSFLPGLLDGTLIAVNYTLSDSRATLPDGREISLPTNSRHVVSGTVGYEKGPLSLRFGGVYRSSYLDEIGGDAFEDRFVTDHFQIDLSIKYRLKKHLLVYAEAVNANNEPFQAVFGGPNTRLLSQFEEYGWTAKWGVRLNY